MLVLSVYVDKKFRQAFEYGQGGNSAVDSALVFAVYAHFSADDKNVFALDADVVKIL